MSSAFDACAQEYDQYRPEYPEALFDDLIAAFGLVPAALVVDIGTGTGRAALPWARRGLRVIGIDPSPPMLERGRATAAEHHLQNLEFRLGTAEQTNLPDGAADALIMAQAFHWVDPEVALAEFYRVLKPGGGLAIFWNDRDPGETYVREMEQLITRYNPQYRSAYRDKPWGEMIAASRRFRNVCRKQYRHGSQVSPETLVGLTRSFSYVRNALNEAETTAFERDLRALLASHARAGQFNLPYITDLWYATRSPE